MSMIIYCVMATLSMINAFFAWLIYRMVRTERDYIYEVNRTASANLKALMIKYEQN